MAYGLLPQMLFSDARKTIGYFNNPAFPPGAYFYALACRARQIVPQREEALAFQAHSGDFTKGTVHYIIEYPKPPPFDLGQKNSVLAPFFSAILHHQETDVVSYYTLGQRPLGGTTLRTVSRDGVNANLGEGPIPELKAFLDAIRQGKT